MSKESFELDTSVPTIPELRQMLGEAPLPTARHRAAQDAKANRTQEKPSSQQETSKEKTTAAKGLGRRAREADYVMSTVPRAVSDVEKKEPSLPRPGPQTAMADGSQLSELVPLEGFLRHYYEWARPTTSAPRHFHLFAALLCIAAVLERRVYIEYGPTNIYPNLYLALIAPSSLFYKTSAQTPAKRLLAKHQTFRNAKGGRRESSLVLPREFSPESLFDILSEQPTGVFLWNELGQQLKRFGRDYMSGAIEFLTEAYDSPEEPIVRRLRSGEWRIEKPCFSIFAASTLHWLETNITEEMALGGFLPRWLLIPGSAPEEFIARPPTLDRQTEKSLGDELGRLREAYKAPEAGNPPRAIDIHRIEPEYETWACDLHADMIAQPSEELLGAWGVRLMPMALKLAVLFEIGTTGEPEVSMDSWERGRTVVDWLRAYLKLLVREDMALTDFQRDRRKVLKLIRSGGSDGVTRSDISRKTKIRKRDLDEIMAALVEDERSVVRGPGRKGPRGPAAQTFIAAEYCGQH